MTEVKKDISKINFSYCFILGAGASCDFGYPTGQGLIQNISNRLKEHSLDLMRDINALKSVENFLARNNRWKFDHQKIMEEYCNKLGGLIFYSGVNSIDRFLSINKDRSDYEDVCKYLIIDELLKSEEKSLRDIKNKVIGVSQHCYRWEENWLRLFFGYFFVRETIEDLIKVLEKDRICFIIFNYDRLLEYFLIHSIAHLYGLEPKKKKEDADKLSKVFDLLIIKHVYGRFDDRNGDLERVVMNYGRSLSFEEIVILLGNIKTMRFDNQMEDVYFELIQNSNAVYFLGFGFDDMNVKILLKDQPVVEKKFYATNFGLSKRVVQDVALRFGRKIIWKDDQKEKVYDLMLSTFGK